MLPWTQWNSSTLAPIFETRAFSGPVVVLEVREVLEQEPRGGGPAGATRGEGKNAAMSHSLRAAARNCQYRSVVWSSPAAIMLCLSQVTFNLLESLIAYSFSSLIESYPFGDELLCCVVFCIATVVSNFSSGP